MRYYLDTNIIIDILNGNKNAFSMVAEVSNENLIRIPDIAYYEILRGFEYKPAPKKQADFERFCNAFGIEYMTLESLKLAAKNYAYLRKNGINIDDDDILIGSLAIANGAVLVTNNTKHFAVLPNIRLENWVE